MSSQTPEQQPRRDRLHSEREERKTPDVIHLHTAVMREMSDPEDSFAPTPVWLILSCFAFVAWGGWYLAEHTYGFSGNTFTDEPMSAARMVAASDPTKPVDPMVLGKRVFNNCTQCHQNDGKGVAGTYPPLAGSEFVLGRKEVLARIVVNGLEGDLTVAGNHYKGTMPAWPQLKSEQIAAVLTYIRASFGNQASPVEPALIESIRKENARSKPWSAPELQEFEHALPVDTPATAGK